MPSVLTRNTPDRGVFRSIARAPRILKMPMDDADGVTGASNGATGTQSATVGSTLAFRTSTVMGVKIGTCFHLFVPCALDFVVGTATTTLTVEITGTDHFGLPAKELYQKTGTGSVYANTYICWSIIDSITILACSAPTDTVTVGFAYVSGQSTRRLPIGQALETTATLLGGIVLDVGGGTPAAGGPVELGDLLAIRGNVDDLANEDDTAGLNSANTNNAYGMTPRKLAVMGVMSVNFTAWTVAPTSCPEYLVLVSTEALV